MNVFGWSTDDQSEWTAPFPKGAVGIKLRVLGGNLFSPDISGGTLRPGHEGEKKNYFNSIPKFVRLAYFLKPRKVFFSLGIGWFGFYVGHKIFGVDSPAYRDFPGIQPGDVYDGSRAMSGVTIRFTRNRPRA